MLPDIWNVRIVRGPPPSPPPNIFQAIGKIFDSDTRIFADSCCNVLHGLFFQHAEMLQRFWDCATRRLRLNFS